jgi:hypothetical protein
MRSRLLLDVIRPVSRKLTGTLEEDDIAIESSSERRSYSEVQQAPHRGQNECFNKWPFRHGM